VMWRRRSVHEIALGQNGSWEDETLLLPPYLGSLCGCGYGVAVVREAAQASTGPSWYRHR
jgi:hypothetical protein